MSWDPAQQDCHSHYGYGSGHRMDADAALIRATRGAGGSMDGYCDRCPAKQGCWDAHRARVEHDHPAEAAAWARAVAKAEAQGGTEAELAQRAIDRDRPDPYIAAMLRNLEHGRTAATGMHA